MSLILPPSFVIQIACLLSPEIPPVKAVELAWEILRKAKAKASVGKGSYEDGVPFFDLAKMAASIPGDLSVTDRFDRITEIFKEAIATSPKPHVRKTANAPEENTPEHNAVMNSLNAADFTEGMESRRFLQLLLPKKKTHADRIKVYRHFLADSDPYSINPFKSKSEQKRRAADTYQVSDIVKGTPRAILANAATFLLWLPGYEQKVRTERARKAAEARHGK